MQELDYSDVIHGTPMPTGRIPRSYENTVLNLISRVETLERKVKELEECNGR
jgi:hypothetical protein